MGKIGRVAAGGLAALFVASLAAAQHEGHQMPGMSGGGGGGACVEHSRQSLEIIESANRRLEEARQSNNTMKMRAAMDEFQGVLGELKTHQTLCAQTAAAMEQDQGMGGSASGMGAMDHSKMGQEPKGAPAAGAKPMDHSKMGQPQSAAPPAGAKPMDHSKMGQPPSAAPAAGAKPMDHSKMGQPQGAAPAAGAKPMDHSKMGQEPKGAANRADASETAIDPVCGMAVEKKSAPQLVHEGKTYYFCSEADKEKFAKQAKKYAKR